MAWKEINLRKYSSEVKKTLNLAVSDDIIEKDLLLTLILAEFEKQQIGKYLVFKGGTLLSRNYLNYHRFSEDLDFVHKDSNKLREMSRSTREKVIKKIIDEFCPVIKSICEELGLEFDTDRSNTKYCRIMHGRSVYTFKIYYSENKFIKVEINFIEKIFYETPEVPVKAITELFDSKKLLDDLNLNYQNFNVPSYSLKEIILEKYRATLTRKKLQERDLFDLFLIKDSLNAPIDKILEKIKNSSLIKTDLVDLIKEKLTLLEKGRFFDSEEKIEELAISEYQKHEFENFKEKIRSILIKICEQFLSS
jgi:predicted nucleotidyltransferase component of viral defense system